MEDKEKNHEKKSKGLSEDVTKYGEIISSYFGWLAPSKQKDRAEELQALGNKKNEKKNNESN